MTTLAELLSAVAGQLEQELVGTFGTIQAVAGQNFVPTPPSLDVYPDPSLFMTQDAYGARNRECVLVVRARVVPTDYDNGQAVLLQMMDWNGDGSVVQALAADPTFGGAAQSSNVEQQIGFALYPDPFGQNSDLLGSQWQLRVIP